MCAISCPVNAITLEEQVSGYAFTSDTRYGPMSHAQLNIAEEASGKLITLVRRNAKNIAEEQGLDLIIIDGPPGIGCPVISSLSGVDYALIVTEPTQSGLHDLLRILELTKGFSINPIVCINKCDINKRNADKIISFCNDNNIAVVGKIPYDPAVTKAMVAEEAVVKYGGVVADKIISMWEAVENLIYNNKFDNQ